jgi:hypothetical protein
MHLSDVETGQCVCRGDPHCFAFDANRFEQADEVFTTNVCAYVLSTDECQKTGTYAISAVFDRVKDVATIRSYVKEIFIFYIDLRNRYRRFVRQQNDFIKNEKFLTSNS